MSLDQALDDGQTNAGAAAVAGAGALAALEALEEQGQVALREGRAVVLEGELDLAALALGGDPEEAAGICP